MRMWRDDLEQTGLTIEELVPGAPIDGAVFIEFHCPGCSAVEDVRDGRVHVARTPRDLEPWLKSFKSGECFQPAFGLCGRCGGIHTDRDVTGEVARTCIRCQADLVEVAFELGNEREEEG